MKKNCGWEYLVVCVAKKMYLFYSMDKFILKNPLTVLSV